MTPTFDMLSSYLIKYSHSKKDVATNWSLYPKRDKSSSTDFKIHLKKIFV